MLQSLVAGGIAGTCTDLFFFPIDTVKTRLQAKGGFFKNGGYQGIYRGVGSAIVASAPGASLFFICYDQGKQILPNYISHPAAVHMASASIGEIAACTVRVPSEVVKQRVQTGQFKSSWSAFTTLFRSGGLYKGYWTTIFREIPFTGIQFPLYEYFKSKWGSNPAQGAVCGMVAGGIAASITTPLDVIKTRLMTTNLTISQVLRDLSSEGAGAFFRGVVPRTMWISLGGAVFLGSYEAAISIIRG